MTGAPALVGTDWLAAHLADGDVRVIDATWYLPHLERDARAEFEAARLPGAVYFDIEAISDHASSLPHMLPAAEGFAAAVGALGIGSGDHVVAYGGKNLIASARAWWMFRVFGHDRVSVLDGGSAKWRAEGRPIDTGRPAAPAARGVHRALPARAGAERRRGGGQCRVPARAGPRRPFRGPLHGRGAGDPPRCPRAATSRGA